MPHVSGSPPDLDACARIAASTASMCWRSEGDRVCSCMSCSASSRVTSTPGHGPGVGPPGARFEFHIPPFRPQLGHEDRPQLAGVVAAPGAVRSEEHTSELQSLAYLVCRLLLEKKKKN